MASRDTWSNRKIWPWNTKWNSANTNSVFPREPTGHSKHPLPTTTEMTLHMDIIRWSILKSDWLYSLQPKMEKLYTVSKNKTGSWLCSDHEFLIAKFRLKLKKIQKTNSPFSHDLNQTHYDYTVKVTNRFKGLCLIDRVPEELWLEVLDIVQEAGIRTIPKKKKCKKAKWLSEEAFQIAARREAKDKKRKDIPMWIHSFKE